MHAHEAKAFRVLDLGEEFAVREGAGAGLRDVEKPHGGGVPYTVAEGEREASATEGDGPAAGDQPLKQILLNAGVSGPKKWAAFLLQWKRNH